MGLDGGTFATRADILRRSSWKLAQADSSWSTRGGALNRGALTRTTETASAADIARIKWSTCALSGNKLRYPVVACDLGALYNRESVLEYLVGQLQFPYNNKEAVEQSFGHLKKISSVFQLQLDWQQPGASVGADTAGVPVAGSAGSEDTVITCPLVHLPADGRYPFVALRPCNHVLSLRALRSMAPSQQQQPPAQQHPPQQQQHCPICDAVYTVAITLNGSPDEVAAQRMALSTRLLEEKKAKKKEKKRRREEKCAERSSNDAHSAAVAANEGGACADLSERPAAAPLQAGTRSNDDDSKDAAVCATNKRHRHRRRSGSSSSGGEKRRQQQGSEELAALNATLRREVAERIAWADLDQKREKQRTAEAVARQRVIDSQLSRQARGVTAAVAVAVVAAAASGRTVRDGGGGSGRDGSGRDGLRHVSFATVTSSRDA